VIEEAPAPISLDAARWARPPSPRAGRAIGYDGAGTVEFIAERRHFLHGDEHPAAGRAPGDRADHRLRTWWSGNSWWPPASPCPCGRRSSAIHGHAVEARLYAEDPRKDFLPATGRLLHLSLPQDLPGVRVDSGVVEGDEISVHYDPMIAKVIAWDESRPAALARLAGALEGSAVVGSATNLEFLARLLRHPAFVAGAVDTGFIARHRDALVPPLAPADDTTLALAALALLVDGAAEAAAAARVSGDPHSPWHRTDGWRLNLDTRVALVFARGRAQGRGDRALWRRPLPPGPCRAAAWIATASRPDRARLEATLGVAG
jgi:3-methylcrotonyl-CoA carboxylase alpha subunit